MSPFEELHGFSIDGVDLETSALPYGTLQPTGTTATNAGTVDATFSSDGLYLYAETGAAGVVDEFRTGAGGSLTEIGSVTVPGAIGAKGIAAS